MNENTLRLLELINTVVSKQSRVSRLMFYTFCVNETAKKYTEFLDYFLEKLDEVSNET